MVRKQNKKYHQENEGTRPEIGGNTGQSESGSSQIPTIQAAAYYRTNHGVHYRESMSKRIEALTLWERAPGRRIATTLHSSLRISATCAYAPLLILLQTRTALECAIGLNHCVCYVLIDPHHKLCVSSSNVKDAGLKSGTMSCSQCRDLDSFVYQGSN